MPKEKRWTALQIENVLWARNGVSRRLNNAIVVEFTEEHSVCEQQEFGGNFCCFFSIISFLLILVAFFCFSNQNIHDWSLALHRPDYWHTVFLLFRKEEEENSPLSQHTTSTARHIHTDRSNATPYCSAHAQVMSVERVHSFAKNGHCIFGNEHRAQREKKKITHFTYTIVCVLVPFFNTVQFSSFFVNRKE